MLLPPALCAVKQPNKIKQNLQLCSINLLVSVQCLTAVFCFSVLFLAGLDTGLVQTGFSVNERWQIQDRQQGDDCNTQRTPFNLPDERENLLIPRISQWKPTAAFFLLLKHAELIKYSHGINPLWFQFEENYFSTATTHTERRHSE